MGNTIAEDSMGEKMGARGKGSAKEDQKRGQEGLDSLNPDSGLGSTYEEAK